MISEPTATNHLHFLEDMSQIASTVDFVATDGASDCALAELARTHFQGPAGP